MKLNVFERLLLRNIIPQIQGWNFAHMKEARELVEGMFTPEEETDLGITQEGKEVRWKMTRADGSAIPQERDLPVSDGLKTKIAAFLTRLDKESRLEFGQYSLYEKFVPKAEAKEKE